MTAAPVFPWSAVVGQERLKLALVLCAIEPAIGGVLVRGPRGVAKTTLARAFAELLPGRFVELPLGATEERVTGSLDLGKALGRGEVAFAPGLLARAHEGVLYVDEVNLLPDALVDLLLDAAATGRNQVERDGVSHVHAARFVLVGTMNPEEGELRPQLLDRFGLCVDADARLAPEERTRIVLRRLEFDSHPARFAAGFAEEQRRWAERCAAARERAAELALSEAALSRAAQLCQEAGVDGVRADLAMLRAARAHAAWQSRADVGARDVDAVAELALAHRRPRAGGGGEGGGRGSEQPNLRGAPPAPPPASPQRAGPDRASQASTPTSAASAPPDAAAPELPPDRPADGSAPDGVPRPRAPGALDGPQRGALDPVPVRAIAPPPLPSWLLRAANAAPPRAPLDSPRQRRRRGACLVPGAIDWPRTLAGDRRSLERRARALAAPGACVIALDSSASMLQRGSLARAKGVAAALIAEARRTGARLALISFGGPGARLEALSERSDSSAQGALLDLGASGRTPLRSALLLARGLLTPTSRSLPGRLLLFTDGRTRDDVDDLSSALSRSDVIVIDCERGALRIGRALQLARTLQARLAHIDELHRGPATADTLGRAPLPTSPRP